MLCVYAIVLPYSRGVHVSVAPEVPARLQYKSGATWRDLTGGLDQSLLTILSSTAVSRSELAKH